MTGIIMAITLDGSMLQFISTVIGILCLGAVGIWRLGVLERRMDANDAKWEKAAEEAKRDRGLLHGRVNASVDSVANLTGEFREMRGELRGGGHINGGNRADD